eukprot:12402699-Karenia_brevis.AAC.1
MIDWKIIGKTIDATDGAKFNRYGKPPCDFMLDNKFYHYTCQQNLYAAILSEHYGILLTSLSLVQLHEDRDSYNIISIPCFDQVTTQMLDIVAYGSDLGPGWGGMEAETLMSEGQGMDEGSEGEVEESQEAGAHVEQPQASEGIEVRLAGRREFPGASTSTADFNALFAEAEAVTRQVATTKRTVGRKNMA